MPTVTCAHCQSSREIEATELAPGETKLRCQQCGKETTVDGLALLQEGASDLELDWGDRAPRPQTTVPQSAAFATAPVVHDAQAAAPIESPSLAPEEIRVSFDFHRADLAARVSQVLLGVGFVGEVASAGLALLDTVLDGAMGARYLPGFKRIALGTAAGLGFAVWSRLALAGRPTKGGRDDEPASAMILAPLRPRRAQRILWKLTRPARPNGEEALPRWATAALVPTAMATLYGWVAWSVAVIAFGPRTAGPGFLLETLLSLCGAATYFVALRMVRGVATRDELERVVSQYSGGARAPESIVDNPAPPAITAVPAQAGLLAASDAKVSAPVACPSCGEVAEPPRCAKCGAARRVRGARMLSVLSQKAHARTYLAQGAEGARFVLKEMAFALAPDATAIAAFERESELLRQLTHPSIPCFLDSFQEGQDAQARFYLAQELIEGSSLEAELADHRYDEAEVVDVIRQMLQVLEYLHGLSPPILHRDLKPANIIRRSDRALVLVDFGAAREGGMTVNSGTLVGTFGYMPPEQLAGQVDETSDLYALGMTALHLLTRRQPWELFADDPDSFPKSVNVSADLQRFLQRLTARRRNQRIPSAHRASVELAQAGGLSRWLTVQDRK